MIYINDGEGWSLSSLGLAQFDVGFRFWRANEGQRFTTNIVEGKKTADNYIPSLKMANHDSANRKIVHNDGRS